MSTKKQLSCPEHGKLPGSPERCYFCEEFGEFSGSSILAREFTAAFPNQQDAGT